MEHEAHMKYNEKDDIDVNLRSFERLSTVHWWDHSTWATPANLSGKAPEAFLGMTPVIIRKFARLF